MNAQELRIGNWVKYGEIYVSIYAVSENGDIWSRGTTSPVKLSDYNKFHPIPLTPEILEMAGFVKAHNTSYYISIKDTRYGVWFQSHTTEFQKEYAYNEFSMVCNGLEYVHQLQNLIFALTGTELNIRL